MSQLNIKSDHYPSPFEEDIVKCWREDIEVIYNYWIKLYSHYDFLRIVWIGINQSHDFKKIRHWDLYQISYEYYIQSLCFAVRHAIDQDKNSISIINILSSIYVHNEYLTIERGFELFNTKDEDLKKDFEEDYRIIWTGFTEPNEQNCISKKIILSKMDKLKSVCGVIRKHTNVFFAHINRKAVFEKEEKITSFKELFNSTNVILEMVKELNLLLNFSGISFYAIPQIDKFNHLYVPWFNKDFNPDDYRKNQEEIFEFFLDDK